MAIRRPGSGEKKMGHFPSLVSCRLIRLNPRVWWAEKKMSYAVTGKGNMSKVSLGLWLWDSTTPENLLEIEGYNLVRADHPNNIKRGGDCIYYKDSLPV